MLALWGIQSASKLPLLHGPLGVVAPDSVLYMRQIELFNYSAVSKQMTC